MIFTTFDRPALYNLLVDSLGREDFGIWTRSWNLLPNTTSRIGANLADPNASAGQVVQAIPYYADQMPPEIKKSKGLLPVMA